MKPQSLRVPLKLLLTNDDGIDAPGLTALFESVLAAFGRSVRIVVVAPSSGQSECGHGVTTGRDLNLREVRPGWMSIDGTPVDCVRAALTSLVPDAQMVLSGVNAGANLGTDLLVSGTFAAAREAAIHGRSAMAVSHYRRPDVPVTWDHVPGWLAETLQEFAGLEVRSLWNVNLPAIDPTLPPPPRVRCAVDHTAIPRSSSIDGSVLRFQTDFHGRPRQPGHDVDQCFNGHLTISQVCPMIQSEGDPV